ncbi:MAG: cadherin-like beta sandwich domain-containing protein [Firmicutes bacterium]|nr:cadherin-like beta sandwich domain-containing protein [Bacillota bacterium]
MFKSKDKLILASMVLMLVASVFLVLNQKTSYAIDEPEQKSGSVSLNCDNTLLPGNTLSCTLKGTVSGTSYRGIEADISFSSNLEFVSFTKADPDSFGDASSTRLVNGVVSGKTGTFNIGTYVVKAKSVNSSSNEQIVISNVKFSDSDNNPFDATGTTKGIRVLSTNNNLSSLSASGTSFSFNANTTTYNLTVDSNTTSTYISAQPASDVTVSGDLGTKNLSYGNNVFKIYVKSASGATKTYTLNITRPDNRSSNANLKSLSISNGKISFNKSTTTYNVTVDSDISSTKISASLEDSRSGYAVGYAPRTVKLDYGTTKAQIKVVAQNGNTKVYTINITRPKKSSNSDNDKDKKSNTSNNTKSDSKTKSSDNKLKSLTLSSGVILFNSDKLSYDVEVPNNIDSIKIEGDTSNSKATVKGLGTTNLKVGTNVVKIVVTAENGDEKTYTLNITRKEDTGEILDNNNYLKDLAVEGYEINFDKENVAYEIKRNGNTTLNIKADPESEKAQIAINGNENLKDKSEIQIVVTAEDGNNRVYTITVVDGSSIMTAIGIFLIGALSLAVAIVYKKRRSITKEY